MIYVTRHGQTDWNVQKKVMGRCDEPLNETGLAQAEETRKSLSDTPIDIIICYDRIIERDFGEFEGKETKDFDFHGYWNYYKNEQYQSAENIQSFFKRVYEFLEDITKKYKGKNVLVVAHGGISIPVNCFFNKRIPEGSLVEAGLVLGNCQVATYGTDKEIDEEIQI